MLKLLKYELLGTYRQYGLIFGCYFIACVVMGLFSGGMYGMSLIIPMVILLFLPIFFVLFVNIVVSFQASMYKRAGYLTLTLPFSTTQILLSKAIGAIIWLSLGILIAMVGIILFALVATSTMPTLADLWLIMKMGLLTGVFGNFSNVIVWLVSAAQLILSIYLTVTFVHTKYVRTYRVAKGVIIYLVGANLLKLLEGALGITNIISGDNFSVTASAIIAYTIYAFIMTGIFFVLTKYLIDNKIEIE